MRRFCAVVRNIHSSDSYDTSFWMKGKGLASEGCESRSFLSAISHFLAFREYVFSLEGLCLKSVDNFKFHGSIVSRDCSIEPEF